MSSSLGPVLVNIILTEFEKLVIPNLLHSGIIKFYRLYVDDTLVLIKPCDIPTVLAKFHSSNKNFQFTVDTFSNNVIYVLDIKICDFETDMYRKYIHAGQYTHFSSFEPFPRKVAWIKSIFHRALMIGSNKILISFVLE